MTFNNAAIYGENAHFDDTLTSKEIHAMALYVNDQVMLPDTIIETVKIHVAKINDSEIENAEIDNLQTNNLIINGGKSLAIIDENTDPKELITKEYLDSKIVSGETGVDVSLFRFNYNEANQEIRLIYNDVPIPNSAIPLSVIADAIDQYWGFSAALKELCGESEINSPSV